MTTLPEPPPPRDPINRRSVALGLAGTALICAVTPYNDYALNNTFLVGNNLPLGVVVLLFLFTLLVNGPLSRRRSQWAFTSGEVTVAFSMTLASCCLPSSGLMRYFPPSLVAPFWHARADRDYADLLRSLHLPAWLFPKFQGESVSDWIDDPIVNGYLYRWSGPGAPPYMAWARPALTWGIFLACLYGALLCMVAITRRQWNENERLVFPLAQIELALVEQPRRGRWLGGVMRSRAFWVGFIGVFSLHIWNGLARYNPKFVPAIPVYYNFSDLLSQSPWWYTDWNFKTAAVFFTAIGATYFLPRSVSFSLWAFFILQQIYKMILGTRSGDSFLYGQPDQHWGAVVALGGSVLWVGRKHWKMVAAQAFRGAKPDEPRGRYLPYPTAFWGFWICAAGMVTWLCVAGSSVLGATVAVAMLLGLFFVITRIIAETGLVHGQLQVPLYRPWQVLAIYGIPNPVPVKTFFLTGMIQSVHYDFREVLPVYASHAMKVADETMFVPDPVALDAADSPADRQRGRRLMAAIALAIIVGYFISFGSTLWTQYHYASTRDTPSLSPINSWGIDDSKWMLLQPSVQYAQHREQVGYSPAGNWAFGFALTAVLSFLRLRYTWWPLHPIGYVMLGTYPTANLWFSIFWGWLAKTVILRFGGPRLYTRARPFFIGLIVGESAAAGFWLLMGIILSGFDIPYRVVNIMPG